MLRALGQTARNDIQSVDNPLESQSDFIGTYRPSTLTLMMLSRMESFCEKSLRSFIFVLTTDMYLPGGLQELSEEVLFNTGFRTYHIGPLFVQVKLWLTKGSDVANFTIF